jgi:putative SOS response-associated peptidase YedK
MCNENRRRIAMGLVVDGFSQTRIPLRFPEGVPNLEPLDSIRITDRNVIVRGPPADAELVMRRWSWPGPNGRPVYNFRSEGREFGNGAGGGRCLIVADGFYEFTAPPDPPPGAPRPRRKDKWLFTLKGELWFCIAGLWRAHPEVGEAFTMLTTEAGPDVAPYHGRQIVVLPPADWRRWLDPRVPAREVLRPLPAGSLEVEKIG